jgi:hypothetical protein
VILCAWTGAAMAGESCVQRPGRHFDAGVAYHLARDGIAHRMTAERGVCVDGASAASLDAAVRQVERRYWEVALRLRGACDEKALVEWAGREGLRFEVTDAVDLQRRPAGRMFHLRSYTDEEVAFHRRKLEEAPKPACPGENVIARLGYHWSP